MYMVPCFITKSPAAAWPTWQILSFPSQQLFFLPYSVPPSARCPFLPFMTRLLSSSPFLSQQLSLSNIFSFTNDFMLRRDQV